MKYLRPVMILVLLTCAGCRTWYFTPEEHALAKRLKQAHIKWTILSIQAGTCQLDLRDNRRLDLRALEGLPIERLELWGCGVDDLTPLSGMPLRTLTLAGTQVTNIAPLKGMKLTWLDLRDTGVEDISPLQGVPLSYLCLADTPVQDITPLQGMPLFHLDISRTQVSDLSPLRETRVEDLNVSGTEVTDLRPLANLPLHTLNFTDTGITNGIPALRAVPSLKVINTWTQEVHMCSHFLVFPVGHRAMEIETSMPAHEFWKRHDAGETQWKRKAEQTPGGDSQPARRGSRTPQE